jgi:hypothetical protein
MPECLQPALNYEAMCFIYTQTHKLIKYPLTALYNLHYQDNLIVGNAMGSARGTNESIRYDYNTFYI